MNLCFVTNIDIYKGKFFEAHAARDNFVPRIGDFISIDAVHVEDFKKAGYPTVLQVKTVAIDYHNKEVSARIEMHYSDLQKQFLITLKKPITPTEKVFVDFVLQYENSKKNERN